MIRHIVFFRLLPDSNPDSVAAELRRLAEIEHVRHLEVDRNLGTDAASEPVDLVVYAEFADRAALAAYKADPRYRAVTERVRPLRESRWAADIES